MLSDADSLVNEVVGAGGLPNAPHEPLVLAFVTEARVADWSLAVPQPKNADLGSQHGVTAGGHRVGVERAQAEVSAKLGVSQVVVLERIAERVEGYAETARVDVVGALPNFVFV